MLKEGERKRRRPHAVLCKSTLTWLCGACWHEWWTIINGGNPTHMQGMYTHSTNIYEKAPAPFKKTCYQGLKRVVWKVLWKNGTMARLIVPVKPPTYKEVKWGKAPSYLSTAFSSYLLKQDTTYPGGPSGKAWLTINICANNNKCTLKNAADE